jgi:glycosyltransferase involved in cell wall biosynthesis
MKPSNNKREKKLNILLVIPELGFGGAQKSISNLSVEFSKKHNVFLCIFNNDMGIAFPFGGEILELDIRGGKNFFQKALFFGKRILQLKKFKKKHRIDLTLSFLEGADYINILSRINNEKIIISIRGSKSGDKEIKGFIGWIRRRVLMANLYKRADKIVSVSEGIRRELILNYEIKENKIITIYNFYDTKELVEKSNEAIPEKYSRIFENKNILINVGRLHVQKNFLGLIKVFSELKATGVNSKLVIIGDGPQRKLLLEFAQAENLVAYSCWDDQEINYDADIFFLGFDTNPLKFIRHSTLFTFTSSWEGFPNSLAEAMIVGIPVITTDCPTGPREILAPSTQMNYNLTKSEYTEYGVLMPMLIEPAKEEKITEWVKAINHLISNESLRNSLKDNAQDRTDCFEKSTVVSQWLTLIEELTENTD